MSTMDDLFACVDSRDAPDVVQNILTAGKLDVNNCWKDNNSLLMVAARRGRLQTVKLLLRLGAKVNAHNKNGKTALMEAAKRCHVDVSKALLAGGADRTARDKDGWKAMSFGLTNAGRQCWELFDEDRIKMIKESEEENAWAESMSKHSSSVGQPSEPSVAPSAAETSSDAAEKSTCPVCECKKVCEYDQQQGKFSTGTGAQAPATSTAREQATWLYPYLADAGFPHDVIRDCEENFVHKHAIYSRKIFSLMSHTDMNPAYFDKIGIHQAGVQRVLFNMHGWAMAQDIVCITCGIILVTFVLVHTCIRMSH